MEDREKDLDTHEQVDDTTVDDNIQLVTPALNTKTRSWLGFVGGTMQIIGKAMAEIARLRK